MARALIICGSAGRGGVTEDMCRVAESELGSLGWDVEVLFPSGMSIAHCTGCDRCSEGPCVIDDDMSEVYRAFAESDLLILASPMHFGGPSSLLKTVMDRFQVRWFDHVSPHPSRSAGMVCAGSPDPDFSHAVYPMKALSITSGMKWMGYLGFPDTDRRGNDGVDEEVRRFIGTIVR